MLRSSLILAAASLLCATAAAQNRVPAGDVLPVDPASVKHAGAVDIVTGKWSPAGTNTKAQVNVFNNTCFYNAGTGFIYYTTSEYCSEFYDEGQIPAGDNTAWSTATGGTGNQNSYGINEFSITYCTWNATVDLEVAFWDNLGGGCVGGVPPTGHGAHWQKVFGASTMSPAPAGYYDLSGIGLPGATTGGGLNCWFVTITNVAFTMQGDGNGTWDNDQTLDVFTWAARINDIPPGANNNGYLITGDPLGVGASTSLGTPPGGNYGPGNCTFDIACGTDWVWGGALGGCGNGYNSEDLWWINTDGGLGDPFGGCPGSANSGCYWFLGYPTNLMGGFWMRMAADTGGGAAQYCTAVPSQHGCVPFFSAGPSSASITAGNPALLTSTNQAGYGNGALIWNKTTAAVGPIAYGWLCVTLPLKRAPTTISFPGGTGGTNCDGVYNWDVNKLCVDHGPAGKANLVVGDTFYVQGWYRDKDHANGARTTAGWGPITVTP